METRRLFLALWPDDALRRRLKTLLRQHLPSDFAGKPVPAANWHVTVVFIGAFRSSRAASLLNACQQIETRPFELVFEQLVHWRKPRIACLTAGHAPDRLTALKSSLESTLSGFGVEPESRPYRPHITVARKARPFDNVMLAQPFRTNWSGFELVESVSTRDGVRYYPLKQRLRRYS